MFEPAHGPYLDNARFLRQRLIPKRVMSNVRLKENIKPIK